MLPFRVREDGVTARDLFAPVARSRLRAGVRGVVVDATAVHDQGASDAQELGWPGGRRGLPPRARRRRVRRRARRARLVEFRFAATDEQFPTIAKLRAARRLWARVLELSGVDARRRASASTRSPAGR